MSRPLQSGSLRFSVARAASLRFSVARAASHQVGSGRYRSRTCILDWQTYHISPGTKDLAYTIVLRYPQRTVANERTLVKRYHERLLAYGVHDYGWEACWQDYRLLTAEHVLYPMRWWMSGLPQDFWGMFVRPALTGFRDLRCAELLR